MTPISKAHERLPWTKEEDEELLELIHGEKRLSIKTIAGIIGRGSKNVTVRAVQLGYKGGIGKAGRLRRYSTETIEKIRLMRVSGSTPEEISASLGIKSQYISNLCKKYGIKSTRYWSDQEISLILQMEKDNKPPKDIALAVNRPVSGIYKKLRELKRPPIIKIRKPKKKAPHRDRVIKSKLAFCLRRARDYGWECSITFEDLIRQLEKQNGECFYTGIPVTFERHDGDIFSIDRIDSKRHYVLDNIVICTWDANRMKQNMDTERFLKMCRLVTTKHKDTEENAVTITAETL